jgi:putative addiction module component (TIGR02574 family)
MSPNEKLTAIEQLWQSLSQNISDIPTPRWHADVLAARERRVREGQSAFVTLDEMKDRLRKATRRRSRSWMRRGRT